MGGELLGNEGVNERDDGSQSSNDQDIRQDAGASEKEATPTEQENLVSVLSTTMDHYWPKFNEWLGGLTDMRNQDLITYERETIVWAALTTMLNKLGARTKISHDMRTPTFCENLKALCGQEDLASVPHGDTVEYLSLRMKEEEFEGLQTKMMRSLLRGRVFEKDRLLQKYHTIAIDGYKTRTFDYEHCEQCLVHKHEKTTVWMHYKLGARLVTPTGFCLPVAHEWVENEDHYDKQDCEIKAFYRLARKIRKMYPRLPICLLLDGLFAIQPVFELLDELGMEYIIVFKDGRMPEAFKWVMKMKNDFAKDNIIVQREEKEIEVRNERTHEERMIRNRPKNEKRMLIKETTYTWMNGVEHWDGERTFNVMTCREVEDGELNCDYVWLVSDGLNLNEDNVVQLAERGRCRWTIENQGINTQKNGGYHLEHLYSRDKISMKIWCAIIDIAHLINQLIEKGSLIVKANFGSIRSIASTMFEHFRYFTFKKLPQRKRIQIRLCWDTS
jgi:hypothetical protein